MNTMSFFGTTSALTLTCAAGLSLLPGCQSTESFTYRSTSQTPQTVTLRNTVTGEALWAVEVPVGKQLDVKFTERPATAEEFGSDVMRWTISPVGQAWAGAPSEVRVPPPSTRRMDVTLRESGEARQTPVIEPKKQPLGTTMPGGPAPAAPATPATPAATAPAAPATPAAPAIVLPDAKQPAPGQP